MAGNDNAASIQACAMRVTRLAADGTTPAGVNNMIVTSQVIKFDVSAVLEEGDEFTVKNGCGRVAYNYKDDDELKRIDGGLSLTNPDPEMSEMITGGSLITQNGLTIGYSAPPVATGGVGVTKNGVCLELWSKAWVGGSFPPASTFSDFSTTTSSPNLSSPSVNFSASDIGRPVTGPGIPANTTILSVSSPNVAVMSTNATATAAGITLTVARPGRFWRWVFPMYKATLGDFSLENNPKAHDFTGPCYENAAIGNGPVNDWPSGLVGGRVYNYFRDNALPAVAPGYSATPAQV